MVIMVISYYLLLSKTHYRYSKFFFGYRYTTADGVLSLNAFDLSSHSQTFHWRSSVYTCLEKSYWNVRIYLLYTLYNMYLYIHYTRCILLILYIVQMTKHLCSEALNRVRLSANYCSVNITAHSWWEGEKGRKHGFINVCTYCYTKREGLLLPLINYPYTRLTNIALCSRFLTNCPTLMTFFQ